MVEDQHSFYLMVEVLVSLIGAGLLYAIWVNVQRHFKDKLVHEIKVKRFDKGLMFLSLSLVVWALSAMFSLGSGYVGLSQWMELLFQNLFSILNSLFLIMALYYLDNAPGYLYNNKRSTRKIIYGVVGLSIVSMILAMMFDGNSLRMNLSVVPDVLLSLILSWFLGVSIYRTFMNRGMTMVAYFSVVSILLLFIVQLPGLFQLDRYEYYVDLLKIVSKTGLISLFLVLGTSWVMELSQTTPLTDMSIHFTDWNQLQLTILSKGMVNKTFEFGKKTTQFNNLLKFAIRRKYAPEDEMCIEIINGGEITSQTYLSRIIENLNAVVGIESNHQLHRNDFFTFIGQGKYRLRFLPDNIDIDAALLKEFVNNHEHHIYQEFVQ